MRSGFAHHAMFFAEPVELVEAALPFLAAGAALGEPAVLLCREEVNASISLALSGASVVTMAPGDVYTRIGATLASFQRMIRGEVARGVRRLRVVAEVTWPDDPVEQDEWRRYEIACNSALRDLPASGVCCFEQPRLTDEARSMLRRAHPLLLTPGGHVMPHEGYVGPDAMIRELPAEPALIPAEPAALELKLHTTAGTGPLRDALHAALTTASIPPETVADVVTATHEVVDNAFRHGGAPVLVRVWPDRDGVTCTVSDTGRGYDDPLAGLRPEPGTGLGLVRRAVDRMHAGHGPDGFTVVLQSGPVRRATRPGPTPAARSRDRG